MAAPFHFIPLIIQEIVTHLGPSDLSESRLINNLWNEMSTSRLIDIGKNKLSFNFNSQLNSYETPETSKTLEEFLRLLRKNKMLTSKFPFVNLKFSGGSLDTRHVSCLFSNHGRNIKKLALNFGHRMSFSTSSGSGSLEEFIAITKILHSVRPSLKYLQLTNLPLRDNIYHIMDLPLYNVVDMAPFLKLWKIEIVHKVFIPSRFLEDLLRGAVNLRVFEGFQINWLPSFTKMGKLHTIKKMGEWSIEKSNLAGFYTFCQLDQVKLVEIAMSFILQFLNGVTELPKIAEGVSRLFFRGRESLKYFRGFELLHFLPGIKLPAMTKVRTLHLPLKANFLPSGSPVLGKVFPNLFLVQLYVDSGWDLQLNNLIEWATLIGSMPSVKIVESYFGGNFLLLQTLSCIFPNIHELNMRISNINNLGECLKLIWKEFKFVQVVSLTSRIFNADKNLRAQIDSSITGFEIDKCEEIFRNSRILSTEEVQMWRVGSSVLDAKCLVNFNLKFLGDEQEKRKLNLVSHVSKIYGFQSRGINFDIN